MGLNTVKAKVVKIRHSAYAGDWIDRSPYYQSADAEPMKCTQITLNKGTDAGVRDGWRGYFVDGDGNPIQGTEFGIYPARQQQSVAHTLFPYQVLQNRVDVRRVILHPQSGKPRKIKHSTVRARAEQTMLKAVPGQIDRTRILIRSGTKDGIERYWKMRFFDKRGRVENDAYTVYRVNFGECFVVVEDFIENVREQLRTSGWQVQLRAS